MSGGASRSSWWVEGSPVAPVPPSEVPSHHPEAAPAPHHQHRRCRRCTKFVCVCEPRL